MAQEIERKFLLCSDAWREGHVGLAIAQGYLSTDPDRTVRIRIAGQQAFITVKSRPIGISRAEFEYEIPLSDARAMLSLCLPSTIEKTRYRVPYGAHLWEIDEFHGANQGLIVAEVELQNSDEKIERPPWIGMEVSEDRRYSNSQLAQMPYRDWQDSDRG